VDQILVSAICLPLSAWGSICKGVTEALPEKSSTENNKQGQIWGKPFS
jgi:hypothetical protein